jgi:hypothetical protein
MHRKKIPDLIIFFSNYKDMNHAGHLAATEKVLQKVADKNNMHYAGALKNEPTPPSSSDHRDLPVMLNRSPPSHSPLDPPERPPTTPDLITDEDKAIFCLFSLILNTWP